MRQALNTDTTTPEARRNERYDREDDAVLSNEEILTHLEAELEVEDDGDPVKGIAIGVLLGTALWVVSLAVLAELL